MKRAIRADAACRIQDLFRGYNCWVLLLSLNNAAIERNINKNEVASNKACRFKDLGHSAQRSITRTSDPCCGRLPRNSPHAAGCSQRVVPRIVSPPVTPMPPSLPVSPESTRLTISIADLLARKHDLKMLLKR